MMSSMVSSINPFGFPTSARGNKKGGRRILKLYSSKGVGFVSEDEVTQGTEMIDKFKVMLSQTISEHAGEPGNDGTFKLFSTVKVLGPREICTFSYITVGPLDSKAEAVNLKTYLETRFARFLVLQSVSSIHLSRDKFTFLPLQDFTESWTDEKLYKKYDLTQDEIAFIESMVRPMPADDDEPNEEPGDE